MAMAVVIALGVMHWIVESLRALAPVGYEDEEGFHFGGPSQVD